MPTRTLLALAAAALLPAPVLAQEDFTVVWHTIDCGGGTSEGDEFSLDATIAQPDAGNLTGPESLETFSIEGGFWPLLNSGVCYANCDGSTGEPLLTSNDFLCFLNRFAANDPWANCDGSTGSPVLTSNDFQCFLNRFATGCP
jgi:hypothetical protein